MLASSDGGRKWVPQTVPPGAWGFNGITCLSASRCYAGRDAREQLIAGGSRHDDGRWINLDEPNGATGNL